MSAARLAWRRGVEVRPGPVPVLGGLVLLLAVLVISAALLGSVSIAPGDLAGMTLNWLGLASLPATWRPQDEVIFFELRLPRVVAAGLVGMALACAGALFQGLLRNPLADPYVIGTSGGASLGAAVGIIFSTPATLLGFGLVPLGAFAGALGATALVYRLARVGGRTPVVTLLLAGFAVSTVLGYAVSLLLILNDRLQFNLPRLYAWLLGGVAVNSWTQLAVVGPLVLVVVLAATGLGPSLNALSLGEDAAARLGVDVERDKRLLIVAGSLLTGAAVTVSGTIGFVGLVVPHVVRMVCGPDNRLLVPASALAGASFLVAADLVARTALAPTELPVGIVTAFLGGPYFLYLLRAGRRDYRL